MRYVYHRPGADDAARLSQAFKGATVSQLVSRNSAIARNSGHLSDTGSEMNPVSADCKAVYTGSISVGAFKPGLA